MLILRRRAGETIRIGEDVEIVILEASPNRVKLGIEAPSSVAVLRGEVFLTQQQNTQSARHSPSKEDLESLAKNFSHTPPKPIR